MFTSAMPKRLLTTLIVFFDGKRVFDNPKNHNDLKRLIQYLSDSDSIILDFFAGSCSTAHATIKANAEDNGTRRFIMVQLPEPCKEKTEAFKNGYQTIAEVSKERIRRVETDLKKENSNTKTTDFGFKSLKLDSSNIKLWDADFDNLEQMVLGADNSLKPDRTADDVLYEILLKYGLDLTLPIQEHTLANKTVYNIGFGALMICLDNDIDLDVVNAIGKLKKELQPEVMRVVFKDAGFANDVVKTNAIQVLKQFGIDDVKSI